MSKPLATVELPYPPTVNHYWILGLAGKRPTQYLGDSGKKYRAEVEAIVRRDFKCRPMIRGRLRVTIGANMPDRLCRDIDNILKASLDAMQHAGLYHDDNQIDDLRIVRLRVAPPGGIKVIIEAIDDMPLFGGAEGQDKMQDRLREFFETPQT